MTFTCPDCPECGNPPLFTLGETAFCGGDLCVVLSWNQGLSRAENMRHYKTVDLSALNGDDV